MPDPMPARAMPGGLVCPVVTPVSPEGNLDGEVFTRHLNSLVPHVEGVFVLGSSGEHPWLPEEVERDVVMIAGEQLRGRAALYVGAGQADLDGTLRAFERFSDSAVDYLVITPPTYFPLSDAELIDGFLLLADRAPRPVLLYNIPQFTGNAISAEVMLEVAQHPAVVGIKDSSGDLTQFVGYLRARPADFRILQGRDHLIAPSLRLGSDGAVAGLANIAAPLLRELLAAQADDGRLDPLQGEVNALAGIFSYGGLVAALKAGLELRGLPVGSPRRPTRPASPAERERIAVILQDFDQRGHLIGEFT